MVCGCLGLCGLHIGSNFKSGTYNPKGYFEDQDFQRINRLILKKDDASHIKFAINKFLDTWQKKGFDIIGWKDTLASFTLPIWRQYIKDEKLKVVICKRPITEIFNSMSIIGGGAKACKYFGIPDDTITKWRRDNKERKHLLAYNLYEIYKKRIAISIKGLECIETFYHDSLKQPEAELRKLCSFIGIENPTIKKAVKFIDKELWHNRQGSKT